MRIEKKLELAYNKQKNLDKLSETDLMIYNSEWKKCSPEEQDEIEKIGFFFNMMLSQHGECKNE